jgi:hypothetical protein
MDPHDLDAIMRDENQERSLGERAVPRRAPRSRYGGHGVRRRGIWQAVPALLRRVAGDDAGGWRVDRNAEERGCSKLADAVERSVRADQYRRLSAVDGGAGSCPVACQWPRPTSRPSGVRVGKERDNEPAAW